MIPEILQEHSDHRREWEAGMTQEMGDGVQNMTGQLGQLRSSSGGEPGLEGSSSSSSSSSTSQQQQGGYAPARYLYIYHHTSCKDAKVD